MIPEAKTDGNICICLFSLRLIVKKEKPMAEITADKFPFQSPPRKRNTNRDPTGGSPHARQQENDHDASCRRPTTDHELRSLRCIIGDNTRNAISKQETKKTYKFSEYKKD